MRKLSINTLFVNIFNLNVDSGDWFKEPVVLIHSYTTYKVAPFKLF